MPEHKLDEWIDRNHPALDAVINGTRECCGCSRFGYPGAGEHDGVVVHVIAEYHREDCPVIADGGVIIAQMSESPAGVKAAGLYLDPRRPEAAGAGHEHREHARLLGQRVNVTIGDQVLVTGKFLAYGEMGECLIQDDEMDVIRCWPLLTIEPAERP